MTGDVCVGVWVQLGSARVVTGSQFVAGPDNKTGVLSYYRSQGNSNNIVRIYYCSSNEQ